MSAKAIAIKKQGWPTYFVSQNKYICICHQKLAPISNIQVVKILKLVDSIDLGLAGKEYNLAKVFIDSDNSEVFDNEAINSSNMTQVIESAIPLIIIARQASNILDKIFALCIGNKSIRVVKRDKYIITITSKLEKIYVDLWGPYNLPS